MRRTNHLLPLFLFTTIYFVFSLPLSAHEENAVETVVIHMNETGYEPSKITIEIGTKVIFENTNDAEHWPASDNHPSHTLYSGTSLEEHCADKNSHAFDSCAGILPGESWSFTFNTPGTHTYHDHLWSHLTGEVTVVAEEEPGGILKMLTGYIRGFFSFLINLFWEEPLVEIINQPPAESDFYQTTVEHYKTLTVEEDPRVAIKHLQEESSSDNAVAAICHDALHTIGKTAYGKYGGFDAAIPFQNDFCNSGYIHGLFEAYFQSENASSTNIGNICDTYASNKNRFQSWQCYHGIGHGFMYHTGGDLDESIKLCQEQFDMPHEGSCINGVYMEIFNAEIVGKEETFIAKYDPFLTCASRSVSKDDCYLYAPSYFLQTLQSDYSEILKACKKVEPGFRKFCIAGVGTEAMKRNMNDPQVVFNLCKEELLQVDQEACLMGAINTHFFQTGDYEESERLCDHIDPEFTELCISVINTNQEFFDGSGDFLNL